MARFHLSRRAALRGMGLGMVSIGLPRLEAMLNERGNYYDPASAQGIAEPKRHACRKQPKNDSLPGPTSSLGRSSFSYRRTDLVAARRKAAPK